LSALEESKKIRFSIYRRSPGIGHFVIVSRIPDSYGTLILAFVAVVVLTIVIYKTRFGYEVRVIRRKSRMRPNMRESIFRTTMLIMVISGGMAGLAGVGEVAGIHHYLSYPDSISSGYGFTAIIVAWLAKLNPIFAVFSGLFFAGILVGGDAIQISLGLPAATVDVFNGTLLFFLIMGDFFTKNKVRMSGRGKDSNPWKR
jgi:ABC-type uncharacterized transport system permease subunit